MIQTEVLIVGGGASGLTASLLLSALGIDTLLVSRHPETSILPKAHLLSSKTMEMYRELGIEPDIRARETPRAAMRYVGWYAGLAGPTPDHGREIARLGAWGRGHEDADWRQASGVRYANLVQARLEPLLRRHAEARAPGRVRFNHGLLGLTQDASGVSATIEDRASGEPYTVRARYMLACDGGRTVGPLLGVTMDGALGVATNISVHFTADLSRWARGPDVLVRAIFNPDVGVPCVLVPMGPPEPADGAAGLPATEAEAAKAWGPHSPQWVFHLTSMPGDHKTYDREQTIAHMRRGLGLPELDPVIHSINRWPLDAVVALRFRDGRVFLLGDAAHRMPPTGGHGLNTAVQDCYNLAWKLALVLRGRTDDGLLDSYEAERRPVAQTTVGSAYHNWQNGRRFAQALDFGPDRTADAMWHSLRQLWDGVGPEADAARRRARNGLVSNLTTYNALNINYGYTYPQGALVADGSPAPVADPAVFDPVQIYQPSTRPGGSVPHAMMEDLHGERPLGDGLGGGRFVLIAGEAGAAWCMAARAVAAGRGVALDAYTIGAEDGDWLDMRREWLRVRAFGADGAILVRPDRFIAWRAMHADPDPQAVLAGVFDTLLAPPNAVPGGGAAAGAGAIGGNGPRAGDRCPRLIGDHGVRPVYR